MPTLPLAVAKYAEPVEPICVVLALPKVCRAVHVLAFPIFKLRADVPPREIGEVPTVILPDEVRPIVELARYELMTELVGKMRPPPDIERPLLLERPAVATPPAKVEVAVEVAVILETSRPFQKEPNRERRSPAKVLVAVVVETIEPTVSGLTCPWNQ